MRPLLFVLLLTACTTLAEPLAQVESNGVRIVLYTAPCALPAIANMPHRAEWTAKGKTFAGCWTLNSFNLIVMYFDDRTTIAIPAQHFARVNGV